MGHFKSKYKQEVKKHNNSTNDQVKDLLSKWEKSTGEHHLCGLHTLKDLRQLKDGFLDGLSSPAQAPSLSQSVRQDM